MAPAPNESNEFESLQQLLALKRHEEPPPGYFDRLPGEVLARIAHAAAHPEPVWRRWLAAWELSPALATSYAAVAVALVLGGVWWAKQSGTPSGPRLVTAPVPSAASPTNTIIASNSAPPGLFNPPSLQVQPVEFKK